MKITTGLAIFSAGTATGIFLFDAGVKMMLRDKKYVNEVLGPAVIDNMNSRLGVDKTARILDIIAEGKE